MICRSVSILAILSAFVPSARAQETPNAAESLSVMIRGSARKVLPTVVTVRAVGLVPPAGGWVGREPDLGGSGVVVDAAKGLILTNHHVVPDAPRVLVTLPDGRVRPVKAIRRDPRSDLALLTIDPADLVQAEWGDSDALDLGDWVLAIGQPFGLAGTVSVGIISGPRRTLDVEGHEDLIQTGAAINPGSSGGPLIDLKGRVVGINVAIKSVGGGYEGVGFAVPGSRARRVAADLAEFGFVRRAYLGITTERIPPEPVGPSASAGVLVASVADDSPAATAGLLRGDILYKIDGRAVTSVSAIRSMIEFAPAGDVLVLTVLRGGTNKEIRVKVAPRPDDPRPPLR